MASPVAAVVGVGAGLGAASRAATASRWSPGTARSSTPTRPRSRRAAVGAFLCAREVVPAMVETGAGVVIFTGATAGTKPYARSAAFGPAKFALRGLGQVMARDLGPQGVHVAYVNVDGAIDMPFIHRLRPDLAQDQMLDPAAIAETYWQVAHQDRSAWTQEIDVRPFRESF